MDNQQNPATVNVDTSAPENELQESISQVAAHMREAGHVESAHFIDVAALILKGPDKS